MSQMLLLLLGVVILSLPAIQGKGPTTGNPLRYFVIGDWGSVAETSHKYEKAQKAVAAQMAIYAQKYQPSFVISVGDNFYEEGVQSTSDVRWASDFVDMYTDDFLQVPWYITLGNHDYMGIVDAQLKYKQDPRWQLPDRNYTIVKNIDPSTTVTFIFLDTSPFIQRYYANPETKEQGIQLASQHYSDQLVWLRAELAKASKKPNNWVIITGHHDHTEIDIKTYLAPLFEEHGVQAYFCGHRHVLEYHRHSTVDYIVSGAGSRVEVPSTFPSSTNHWIATTPGFVLVEMYDDVMHSHFIDYSGQRLHSADTYRAANNSRKLTTR